MALIPVFINPECSATPTPSIATNTIPKGAKLVNVVTIPDRKAAREAPVKRLLITIGLFDLGSISLNSNVDNPAESSQMANIRMTNKIAGSGSLFPPRSMRSSARFTNPFGLVATVDIWLGFDIKPLK